MKKSKLVLGGSALVMAGIVLVAADHIDAPSTAGTTADIADFYAFEPEESSDHTVFVMDLQSNVLPELAYGTFDEGVLTEINLDLDGDLVEDYVIQAIPRDGHMYFFAGAPATTGLDSKVMTDVPLGEVEISGPDAIVETTDNGVSLFAGPRQDSFFFDFFRFNAVIDPAVDSAPDGFLPPDQATDTFDGANTLSIVVEIPNSMLGSPSAQNALGIPVYKTWVTTNTKK